MKVRVKKCAYAMALCLGLVSATLIACGDASIENKAHKGAAAVPAGFAEQRMLADAVDTLDSFKGGVILPLANEISLHGKEVIGGLEAVMTFLDERKNGLNYIYKKYQKVNPGFEGKITMDVTVDPCGDVSGIAEISSDTGVPEFNTEIKASLGRQKFPKTDQGHYTVSMTLAFANDLPAAGAPAAGAEVK
ncbi:MAG: AgmX/PglI C-terminal domain-containing protein [Fibrobacter sp.]|nr:AgmX/PglI C-terminal domain-containing protein [Fibrobacter sp.]